LAKSVRKPKPASRAARPEQRRGAKPVAAVPPPAVAAKPKSKWALIAAVVVAGLLVGQGVIVFMGNKSKEMTVALESAIAGRGQGKGEVVGCRTLAVDKDGNVVYVYGVGQDTVVQRFSPDGKFIARFENDPKDKKKERALNNVWAVATDAEDRVWVCERGTGRVIRLSPELKWETAVKAPSTDLTGIAVDSQGRVLVASYVNKIYVFDSEGALLKEMNGDTKQPLITAYRLCVDEKDNIYVLDAARGNGKEPDVKAYDKNGKGLGEWLARGLPFNELSCIGWDPKGYVVLNNNGLNSSESQGIQLYSPNGKLKGRVTASNTALNLMSVPGLAIGARGDWALDPTPQGRGCDRFTLMTQPVK